MQNGVEPAHAAHLDANRLAVGQTTALLLLHVPQSEACLLAQYCQEIETALLPAIGIAMHSLTFGNTELFRLAAAALVCQYGLFIGAEAFVDFAIGLAEGILIHAIIPRS